MWTPWKKEKTPVFNIHHPDIAHQIEEAFKCGGKTYYRFKQEYDMPAGRYKWLYGYLREVDLRMSLEVLNKYIEEIEKSLNGGKKGVVDLGNAFILLSKLKTRTKLAFEPDGVRKLASVVYFDSSEDLSGFSQAYGEKKVLLWKKHNFLDFFLTRPMCELLKLKNSSIEVLEEYIKTAELIIQDLTLEPSNQLQESSSESGKKTL